MKSSQYFEAAFLLSVRDFEYISEKNTADLPSWLVLIMADLIFSDMPQFVILAPRKGSNDVAEEFLLAVVTQWPRSMFLMISSFEKCCIFFEISFASTIFVSSHVFSDCCFLMFLKISVFLRLLFLRSSTSTSNSRIVIAWLLTVSFSSANLNFKLSIYSLFSRLCTSFMGCSLNCIYLEESMSHYQVSLLMILVLCQAH